MEQWVRQLDADMREIARMRPDRLSVHLHLNVGGRDAVVIVPTLGLSAIPGYGQEVHLAMNENSIHLFDKETEVSLLK